MPNFIGGGSSSTASRGTQKAFTACKEDSNLEDSAAQQRKLLFHTASQVKRGDLPARLEPGIGPLLAHLHVGNDRSFQGEREVQELNEWSLSRHHSASSLHTKAWPRARALSLSLSWHGSR
jgi:hypothetical protein